MSRMIATEDGQFVSEDHKRIAEIIHDYDPALQLAWIPPAARGVEDDGKEFAVIHTQEGRPSYFVFFLSKDEVDHRVLTRLWEADNKDKNVLTALEAQNAAIEAIRMKQNMDDLEDKKELVGSIIKSPKSKYKHNGVAYQ